MDTSEHPVNRKDLTSVFTTERRTLKQWIKDHQIGIYSTVIFHLLVFLILALNELHTKMTRITVIELVHHVVEEEEPEISSEEEKERLKKELDKMLNEMPNPDVKLPNMAVNAAAGGSKSGKGSGSNMSFFSNRNTSTLQNEKEKEKAKEESEKQREKRGVDEVPDINPVVSAAGEAYKGPSVVSYYLYGRTALSLPVPAYKCLNGGDVTIIIEVNKFGYVLTAEVDSKNSSKDDCLHIAAKQAALTARFSSSSSSEIQKGNIVYRFVSQQ
ncbi:MAG: hypothetical protein LBR10_14040 [Prevotellaceae bacterium]|jgi:hypothetical protein|nr:hypothetical protein [Prevotellaceae bacterium]